MKCAVKLNQTFKTATLLTLHIETVSTDLLFGPQAKSFVSYNLIHLHKENG